MVCHNVCWRVVTLVFVNGDGGIHMEWTFWHDRFVTCKFNF